MVLVPRKIDISGSIDSNVGLLNGLGSVHEQFDAVELGPASSSFLCLGG